MRDAFDRVETIKFSDGAERDISHLGLGAGDWQVGDSGNDELRGTSGDDVLIGSGGDDKLLGLRGDDYLLGGDGNDKLIGGGGNDTLKGGVGDDVLKGGVGDDILEGGSGNDTINAGSGADRIIAGAGNDTYKFGLGIDEIDYSAIAESITLIRGGTVNKGLIGTDTFTDFYEKIIATDNNDDWIDGITGGGNIASLDVNLAAQTLTVSNLPGLGSFSAISRILRT